MPELPEVETVRRGLNQFTLKNHFDDTRPKDDSSYHTSSDPLDSI
ncbi:MAG: DNA-formamidopyrimidine glycosylase family protein [Dolichospermum sp.]